MTPVFNVKASAHLDYLAPKALKEIEVSEQWSHSNEMLVSSHTSFFPSFVEDLSACMWRGVKLDFLPQENVMFFQKKKQFWSF